MPKDGFNDLNKFLNNLEQKVQKASGEVSFEDLFNEEFMQNYSDFSNINEFFNKSPFEFDNEEEFDRIDEKELDKYVSSHTKFSSWDEMKGKAGEEEIVRRLGL